MIPTEPIGSIPRPFELVRDVAERGGDDPSLNPLYADAVRDTVARFEATGSPVITDGEHSGRSSPDAQVVLVEGDHPAWSSTVAAVAGRTWHPSERG